MLALYANAHCHWGCCLAYSSLYDDKNYAATVSGLLMERKGQTYLSHCIEHDLVGLKDMLAF